MTLFQNILFPTDGSPEAKKAQETVKELALKFSAHVTVLNSYEFSGLIGGYEITPTYLAELDRSLEENAKKIVTEAVKDFENAGIKTKQIIAKGDPANTIQEAAEKEQIDLVVMGSRGLGAVKGFLLGSVSNYVLHHVKCPVMLIQSDKN